MRASVGISLAAVQDAVNTTKPAIQTASPTTGQTVVMTDSAVDGTLYLTPAGALLALTVTFPTNANSVLGQIRRIASTQAVTTLTLDGATILNPLTAIVANTATSFQKVASNTWIRL